MLIKSIFITSLIVANVCAYKLVNIFGFLVPSAVVSYAFTFLFTDLISEKYGKEESNKLVWIGFICMLFSSTLFYLATILPSPEFAQIQEEYFNKIFSLNIRFSFASLVAYTISQKIDIEIFHFLKDKFINHKWIRNNGSTIVSQFIDTAIFISIAFYRTVPDIFELIIGQFTIKLFLALLDTPLFYLLTHKGEQIGKD